jgi:MFS transporter, PAT family, beta-lactamase induction signal transducer AmpG
MVKIAPYIKLLQNPKFLSLILLGGASGLPLFLTSRTLQLWLQDAKVDIGTISLFGIVSLPYALKFIWSPLLDRFTPPFLGLRRGWLLISQLGLMIAIAVLASQHPSQNASVLQTVAIACLGIAFLSATQDIAGDAYRTEILKPDHNEVEIDSSDSAAQENTGDTYRSRAEYNEVEIGSSLWVWGYRGALFITSSLALILADYLPWNVVYFLMAALMGLSSVITVLAPEPPRRNTDGRQQPVSISDVGILAGIFLMVGVLLWWVLQDPCSIAGANCGVFDTRLVKFYWILGSVLVAWVLGAFFAPQSPVHQNSEEDAPPQSLKDATIKPLQEFLHRSGLVKAFVIIAFILLYKLGDSLVGISANLFLRSIDFTKAEIGAIQGGMGFIATTVGVLVGGAVMIKIGLNRALWIFGVCQILSNLGYWALANTGKNYSMLVLAINIENFCAGLVTVATVAYLTSLCSRNFATTQFALFSSLMAIGRDVLAAPAGELAKATGWPSFFLLSIVAALPGMFLLPIVAPWQVRQKL